jgi:hypothetical protein
MIRYSRDGDYHRNDVIAKPDSPLPIATILVVRCPRFGVARILGRGRCTAE